MARYDVSYKYYHSNAGYLGVYHKEVEASSKSEARKTCKEVIEKNKINFGGIHSFRIGKAVEMKEE